jgi:predicted Rossmann fold nucleotide-binding protein DprA/Smf involved in DNA uptake
MTTDDLLDITGLDLPQLQDMLFNLQLDGHLKQNAAGLWHAVF